MTIICEQRQTKKKEEIVLFNILFKIQNEKQQNIN